MSKTVTLAKIQFWSLILESETNRSFKTCLNSDCACTLKYFDTKLTVKLCFPALFIQWIILVVLHVSHETSAKVVANEKCYINMAFNFEHYAVTSCSSRALLPTTPAVDWTHTTRQVVCVQSSWKEGCFFCVWLFMCSCCEWQWIYSTQIPSTDIIISFKGVSVMGDACISFTDCDGNALAVV